MAAPAHGQIPGSKIQVTLNSGGFIAILLDTSTHVASDCTQHEQGLSTALPLRLPGLWTCQAQAMVCSQSDGLLSLLRGPGQATYGGLQAIKAFATVCMSLEPAVGIKDRAEAL